MAYIMLEALEAERSPSMKLAMRWSGGGGGGQTPHPSLIGTHVNWDKIPCLFSFLKNETLTELLKPFPFNDTFGGLNA
jgi:hypothetical protein